MKSIEKPLTIVLVAAFIALIYLWKTEKIGDHSVKDVKTEIDDATIKEGNIGITTKKGKTIELTHKKSGKEIVVTNTPSTLKKYARMGYLISMPEGKLTESRLKDLIRETMYTMGANGMQAIETGVIHLQPTHAFKSCFVYLPLFV